jgi:hypothetical protein
LAQIAEKSYYNVDPTCFTTLNIFWEQDSGASQSTKDDLSQSRRSLFVRQDTFVIDGDQSDADYDNYYDQGPIF